MRFEMARAGERVDRKTERNGQQVRDMYEQVLLEDPNHPKADLASLRLGELYDHIILRDSVRDPNKAIPHFKRVIDKAKKKRERQREGDASILLLPAIEGGLGNAHFSDDLFNANTCFCLAESIGNLLLCEPALFHGSDSVQMRFYQSFVEF